MLQHQVIEVLGRRGLLNLWATVGPNRIQRCDDDSYFDETNYMRPHLELLFLMLFGDEETKSLGFSHYRDEPTTKV